VRRELTPEDIARIVAVAQSPEGRARIDEALRKAEQMIDDLREKRKVTPEMLNFRVTI